MQHITIKHGVSTCQVSPKPEITDEYWEAWSVHDGAIWRLKEMGYSREEKDATDWFRNTLNLGSNEKQIKIVTGMTYLCSEYDVRNTWELGWPLYYNGRKPFGWPAPEKGTIERGYKLEGQCYCSDDTNKFTGEGSCTNLNK